MRVLGLPSEGSLKGDIKNQQVKRRTLSCALASSLKKHAYTAAKLRKRLTGRQGAIWFFISEGEATCPFLANGGAKEGRLRRQRGGTDLKAAVVTRIDIVKEGAEGRDKGTFSVRVT